MSCGKEEADFFTTFNFGKRLERLSGRLYRKA
jgi:hypothetical protein